MLDVVKRVYGNYAQFSGRESRPDFWLFQLFIVIILSIGAILNFVFATPGLAGSLVGGAFLSGFNVLVGLFIIATIVPAAAQHSRRFHDANLSAWWLLLALIPGLGVTAIYVMALVPSAQGVSRFEFEGGSSNFNNSGQTVTATQAGTELW